MVKVSEGYLVSKPTTPSGKELPADFLPSVGGINVSHITRQIVVESPDYFDNAIKAAQQFEQQFRLSGFYYPSHLPEYTVFPLYSIKEVPRDFTDPSNYPKSLIDLDSGAFLLLATVSLDNYITSRYGNREIIKDVVPSAIKTAGFLMENNSRDYFESKPKESKIKSFFNRGTKKSGCFDEFALQAYLCGKELQRFEDLSIKRLRGLEAFIFQLTKSLINNDRRYVFPITLAEIH